MSIPVVKSTVPPFEEFVNELKPIFESRILTNAGTEFKRFHQLMTEFLEVPYSSLFVNGHMALEIAIQALGLNVPDGEVITTPYTFISTTHAITRNGLKPVFCDIRESDYTMDPDKIEALITDKTVAIIPVHVYGKICDVEKIDAIGKKHGLKVIYDAAHAFGIKYKGVSVGNFGDASMFSFHATKVFNSIEGGCITFKDQAYEEPLQELKNFGIHTPEDIDAIGCNAKMDEIRAAMGICNLRHLDETIASRKAVCDRYAERLGNTPGIILPKDQDGVTKNYSYMPIIIDEEIFGESRDVVCDRLKEHDITARKYFYPAINDTTCYKNERGETPIAHKISLRVLTLPLYEALPLDDVDTICDVILKKQ